MILSNVLSINPWVLWEIHMKLCHQVDSTTAMKYSCWEHVIYLTSIDLKKFSHFPDICQMLFQSHLCSMESTSRVKIAGSGASRLTFQVFRTLQKLFPRILVKMNHLRAMFAVDRTGYPSRGCWILSLYLSS